MRVAVVTPFHRPRLDWLAQCHASVRAQTHACDHILISDGAGPVPLADFSGTCIQLPQAHGDFGDAARAVGAALAAAEGYQAMAFLDDDNWYYPDHIASMVDTHRQTGAVVCSAGRDLYSRDGERLGVCPRVDGQSFVDTSCLFLTAAAFDVSLLWALVPADLHAVGDRYVWAQLKRGGHRRAHRHAASVAYRTHLRWAYEQFGRRPPDDAQDGAEMVAAYQRLRVWLSDFDRDHSAGGNPPSSV